LAADSRATRRRAPFAAPHDILFVQRVRRLQRAFSPVTVCSIYTMQPNDPFGMLPTIRTGWGFSPERDQQIGGLLMWVPMCLIYFTAILAQITRWFAQPTSPAAEKI
jgi:cytochrome c oxidase assembly factor CtaG